MIPEIVDGLPIKDGGIVASVIVGLAAAWKLFFRAKKDVRADRSDTAVEDGYSRSIKTLSEHVERQDDLLRAQSARIDEMAARMADLTKRLIDEMDKHRETRHAARDAEQTVIALRHRVAALEQEISDLKRGLPVQR